MTQGQQQAIRDAYTTLRAIREGFLVDKELINMARTSEYLLVAEFPEVKQLEMAINQNARYHPRTCQEEQD